MSALTETLPLSNGDKIPKDYDKALAESETTMDEVGLDYLDLYPIHAPWPWDEIGKTAARRTARSGRQWRGFWPAAGSRPSASPTSTSPFAHGLIVNHPEIADIAARYGVSAPQLCIRYLLQEGAVVLPKATSTPHIKQNAELDLEISAADMAVLDAMRETDQHEDAV